jgi:cyclopropane fatty-acyl-phospholipid synthase-like methyltransferase
MSIGNETIREFWLGRTQVPGPAAARFHSQHDAYDLEAIERLCGPGSRVLDLGCGTCVLANLIVDRLRCWVHAVDYVPDFLESALDHPRLTTEVGDVRSYEGSGRYDLILSLGVITYLETEQERRGMYERCARLLAPGAPMLIKAQFGVDEEVRVETWSEDLGAHYRAVYPRLEDEALLLDEWFDLELRDPYPPEFSPWDNTHFHHIVARRRR